MENIHIAPPWVQFTNALRAMFIKDPDVVVVYDNTTVKTKVLVANTPKAEALEKLLPSSRTFGDVELKIEVVPANEDGEDMRGLLLTAFAGNPVLKRMVSCEDGAFHMTYALFEKDVVQYYNDNMGDPIGMTHRLYQDIARDIFPGVDNIFFTTEYVNDDCDEDCDLC